MSRTIWVLAALAFGAFVAGPALAMKGDVATGTISGTTVRNLATGKIRCVSGEIRDAKGLILNGTIKVMQGSTVIGQTKTSGGIYHVYDLKPGTYVFKFTSTGGKTAGKSVTVVSGKVLQINFRL
ncbi:MAG: carboxypeptidase-like regulatory domain-containing protein [Deltaproteobacteria bacterium]|nr:carboxypeptidase-like regulatory domain-containing protein [Deltaproteobacteria bacterium]